MKKRSRTLIGCVLSALALSACGKPMPDDLIMPDKMEAILYDYHLALGINYDDNVSKNYRREAYRDYIYKKHGVTAAEFDSSMVWYTRHTTELSEIYDRLGERFNRDQKYYSRLLQARDQGGAESEKGDTVDLWFDKDLHFFNSGSLANHIHFEFREDKNYHDRDSLVWIANYTFFTPGLANMGISVTYANDSVAGKDLLVSTSGEQRISLCPDTVTRIKMITGHIRVVNQDSTSQKDTRFLVNNLSLMRYNRPMEQPKKEAKKNEKGEKKSKK